MPGFDDVTSALDSASQALAGGTSTSTAAAPPADATFTRGIHIDEEDPNFSGATSPNLLNEKDSPLLLEFIHFGNVHTTYSNFFPHSTSYKDNEKDDRITANLRPRAIQFRSALEREAVLLGVFMECAQTVLQDRDDAKGALSIGAAMNTLGSLVGDSGGGSGQTTASDVNPYVQQTVTAIQPALVESITYPNVHQAGHDLHQTRANYRALLTKVAAEKPSSDPGSSLIGGALTKISSGLGGVGGTIGDVINFAQGVVFKPQDIKVKFFIKVAIQQEPQIELACHAMTLQAIKDGLNPVLPVWFGDPNAQATKTKWDSAPASPLQRDNDSSNLLGRVVNPVADKVTSARDKAVDTANDVKDFFENPIPPTPPPGTDFLDQAFDVPKPAKNQTEPMPMAMGALAVTAFIEALGLPSPLNSFCEGVISTVFGITLDFIHGTYEALLARDPQATISDQSLYTAAKSRLQLIDRLLALAGDKVAFIQTAEDDARKASLSGPMGYDVGVGQLLDKEGNKLDDMIADKVGPLMEDALKTAMAGLAQQLDLARTDGNDNNCLTMEWYLGRLPWIEATLFFDLFFPFWNALLQCVMNVVDPAAASVIKGIVGAANTAKGYVDTARDTAAKAKALKAAADNTVQQAASGVHNEQTLKNLGTGYGSALNKTADKTTAPDPVARGFFTVPVTGRSVTGTGQDVDQSVYDQVQPQFQWDNANSPDGTPAKTDDNTAAASPAGAAAPAGGS